MYYLYYKTALEATNDGSELNYPVKWVSVNFKNRKLLSYKDYLWRFISLGGYHKVCVFDKGAVIHTSTVIGRGFKFPFLKRGEAQIGPCFTKQDFRGQGIYPAVLKLILSSGKYKGYYMLVRDDNAASIRGIEKAGFSKIGTVEKDKYGRWVKK